MQKPIMLTLAGLLALLLGACGQADRAQAYLDKGLALYAEGNLVKARLEFRNVLQISPRDARAWFMLGQIAEREQDWEGGLGSYSRAVEFDPSNVPARIKKGALLLAGGDPSAALVEAEAVLAADPDDPGALALRGAVKQRQGDLDGGIADAQAALASDPDYREALGLLAGIRLEQEQPEEAQKILEAAVQSHPDQVSLKLMLAAVYEKLQEAKGAERVLREVIEQEPAEFAYRLQLARYLAAQGQVEAAQETLEAAVEAAPDDLQRKLMLIDFLAGTKGADAAIEQLKQWISASPDDHALRFALADRYRMSSRLDDMAATYREVIERDPGGPDGLTARGKLASLTLAQNEPDDALALAEEVLGKDAQNADALLVRAAIAIQRGSPDQAILDLRALLRNDPDAVGALRLLSQAHVLNDELPLAQDALEKAIEAAPKQPSAYMQLAELRANMGNARGAAEVLGRLLAEIPEDAAAQGALARLQLAENDMQALEKTADLIRESRPADPLGYYLKGLALQAGGKLEASVVELETALEKEPKAAEPLVALVQSYLALEQSAKAESRLEQLLEQNPVNVVAANLLGEVYLSTGQTDKARDQYRKAIEIIPGSPTAYQGLARIQMADADAESALATLQSGIQATQRNVLLVLSLAVLRQQLGDFDGAMAAYEEVLQQSPANDAAANNIAMLIADHRASDQAAMRRALEIAARFETSDRAAFLDTAGWVRYRSGDYEQAASLLEKAMGLEEATPERQYHLGMVYLAMGRLDEGKALLAAAVGAGEPFAGIEDARAALEAP